MRGRRSGGSPYRRLALGYRDHVRLYRSWWSRGGLALALVAFWWLPTQQIGDPGLRTLALAGIAAIGAIGLNLLTGVCGQVSLGHAFFVGVGAYSAAHLGGRLGWPLPVYLVAAALLGAGIGAAIGPFALRLRGNYLVVVTLGLVVVGDHVWRNWESVTGGGTGVSLSTAPMSVAGLDLKDLQVAGVSYTFEQAMFWLVWALVAVAAVLARNLVRSRPGRAMQAIRDRDLSAEIIGVDLARTKVGAFAWSSAYAAVAGALYGLLQQYVSPQEFGLFLSITYVAVIIIGGIGTVFGSVLGALFVFGGRALIEQSSDAKVFAPILSSSPGDPGWFTLGELNAVLFGLCIVGFLLFEPRGLAAFWFRIKAWLSAWPFSY